MKRKLIETTKGQMIRKEIHIPPEVLTACNILAAKMDKSSKEYIEDLVIEHVKPKKK